MENFIRPPMTVLSESAQIPARNLIDPPPKQFTHEVSSAQPFYYHEPSNTDEPSAGTFAPGTKVVLMNHGHEKFCWVVDSQGLYVTTASPGLKAL